jgi:hypothetical protein
VVKKALIFVLLMYVLYADILTYIIGNNLFKFFLSILAGILFVYYVFKNINKVDFFLIIPLVLIPIYIIVWPKIGYINLIYTILFGWAMSKDYVFTIKILKTTFYLQFLLILYEVFFSKYIYISISTGIVNESTSQLIIDSLAFDETGFRPKGLFSGTLVATSFIIYLTMLYRNNIKMLLGLFIMALIVNGRLALLISLLTLLLQMLLKYDIRIFKKKLSFFLKMNFIIICSLFFILILLFSSSEVVKNNYFNIFNLNSTANIGRLISYFQSIDKFLNFSFLEMIFGSPNSVVTDQYGRETASESGFLSMALDLGIIGLALYLITLLSLWKTDNSKFISINLKSLGYKYIIIITFISFLQYEHINGNLRGALFWFMIISSFDSIKTRENLKSY